MNGSQFNRDRRQREYSQRDCVTLANSLSSLSFGVLLCEKEVILEGFLSHKAVVKQNMRQQALVILSKRSECLCASTRACWCSVVSLSVSLCISLSLISVSLCVSISVFFSLSVSEYLSVLVSLPHSLSVSISVLAFHPSVSALPPRESSSRIVFPPPETQSFSPDPDGPEWLHLPPGGRRRQRAALTLDSYSLLPSLAWPSPGPGGVAHCSGGLGLGAVFGAGGKHALPALTLLSAHPHSRAPSPILLTCR